MLNALKMTRKSPARKDNPILADIDKPLTKIEQNVGKLGGGGALKRATATSFSHGRIYLCQRLILICGNGVFLSSESFARHFRSI